MDIAYIPPPPYSETDPASSPRPALTPATSQVDSVSVAASSVDETIYTPPYSPTGSVHRGQTVGDSCGHVSSSSATAYFESRPVLRSVYGTPEIHSITISARTQPEDLPYPPNFLSRDCIEQDWATFLNFLLPGHLAGVNNEVADRKLQAELLDGSMQKLGLSQEDRSDTSEVDAQLEHLRQQPSPSTAERLRILESTISEWNEGFFGPRGLQITTIDPDAEIAAGEETSRMPGSWIPWEEDGQPESSRGNLQGRRRFFGLGSNPSMEAGSQGFRLGPIVANHEGFRIGKGLVANNESFRIGNVILSDQHGFRLGGSRGFVKDHNGVSFRGRTFGRRESFDHPRGWGHHGHRGRSHSHRRHARGRSSSTSSSSSSSDSDSISSVGSLPDYDDLKDQQLPIAKQSLMAWLNHPEQPITKAAVHNMKKDIRAAKKGSPPPELYEQDLRAMRGEVKDLLKTLKEHRKTQKRRKKEARRERRAARRLEKKERWTAKREARRGKRAERYCDRGGRPSPPWNMTPSPAPPTSTQPVGMPGFPFGGAAPLHFRKPPFGRGPQAGPFGIQAMHGGWPFTQGLSYEHGRISVPNNMTYPTPISHSAEEIHTQALQMEEAANLTENKAIELRTASTGRRIDEKQRLKSLDEATQLEEEAEKYRMEADRLRAEAMHLDGELARELEEDGGQASGVIQN